MSSYISYQIEMSAEIAGVTLDITQFICDFELNGIPRGTILLPVGRNIRTGKPAAIHALADKLKMRQPVTVYVQLLGGEGRGAGAVDVPKDRIKIFEGYTSGVSRQRFRGGLYYRIGVTHWLLDLTGSSMLSVNMHPANPVQFTFGALITNSSGGGAAWAGVGAADELTDNEVREDVWAAIRKWLISLADSNSLEGHALLDSSKTNQQALKALNRMPTGNPPLALDIDTDVDLTRLIAQEISTMSQDVNFVGSTSFWDVLAGPMSSSFLFAVIPRVDDALVVPYVPCLRDPYIRVLGSHYGRIDGSAECPQPLRAVCVCSGFESAAGAAADGYPDKAANYLGGVYPRDLGDDGQTDGIIKIINGPGWLKNILASGPDAKSSAPVPGNTISTAISRTAGTSNERRVEIPAKAKVRKSFLDQYAHARYALEMLQGRSASIAGPVRFDICPGSTIFIEGASTVGIPGDQLASDEYATVLRVSYTFDSQGRQAGTAFHLGYTRNADENADDKTSIAAHPLYAESWNGAKLVDT